MADISEVLRQHEVEQFYFAEAALLDERRFDTWLELFADDLHYFMPIRRTMASGDLSREFTAPGEMAFFDDNRELLAGRVKKLGTGRSWSEDPPSRTRHFVSNVRILDDDGVSLEVEANFHLHRTRLRTDEDNWYGRRSDTLRRNNDSFLIARRYIYLEQTVVQSPNMSVFF